MGELHGHAHAGPPEWALFLGDLGQILIIGGTLAFLIAALAWAFNKTKTLERVGTWGFALGSTALFGACAILGLLFAQNQFQFNYVWGHTALDHGLAYRVSGIWAGQEGSFLLWAVCAAMFGLFTLRGTGIYKRWYIVVYAVFLASIGGILAYETPFELIMTDGKVQMPLDGVGLAPPLQNYWFIFHPPIIFLGFGALTIPFAYAVAALLNRNYDSWVPLVRPWVIAGLSLLGLGLCFGGFWAYETLGWGGFWMWDPVENTSFVPWCLLVGLLHAVIVKVTKRKWTMSTLILAGLPFISFVYGTFLTRSGVLSETSVHSFAEMDSVALNVLKGLLAVSTLGFLGLWGTRLIQFRGQEKEETTGFPGWNREAFYRVGVILVICLGIAAAIGMSVPMLMALAGKKPAMVEEPVYHLVLPWFFVPVMVVMAIAPLIAWRGMGTREFIKRVYGVLCVTLMLIGLTMVGITRAPWAIPHGKGAYVDFPMGQKVQLLPWMLVLIGLSYFVAVASSWRIVETFKRSKMASMAHLAHMGVALLIGGLIISRGFEQKVQVMIPENGHTVALNYFVTHKGSTATPNDKANRVLFEVEEEGKKGFTAKPNFYMHEAMDGRQQPFTWPHIERKPLHDVYFTLHPPVTELSDPKVVKPGETVNVEGIRLTYLGHTSEDGPHGDGMKIGAKVLVQGGHSTRELIPKMEFHLGKIKELPVDVDRQVELSVSSIDATTMAATLHLKLKRPIYPVELYVKPMTILVWIGTILLTLACLGAAWDRRPRKGKPAPEFDYSLPPLESPIEERELAGVA